LVGIFEEHRKQMEEITTMMNKMFDIMGTGGWRELDELIGDGQAGVAAGSMSDCREGIPRRCLVVERLRMLIVHAAAFPMAKQAIQCRAALHHSQHSPCVCQHAT
jgi:hypothetical protein